MRRRGPILAALLGLLASCAGPESVPAPRLLLLVSVDTLRADRLGAYGSGRDLSPHVDALARESQVFRAAYAPSAHTFPSVTALLTGRYPEELGVWSNESLLLPGVDTLARAFAAAGWNTSAVVSNWVLRGETGMDGGFQHFDDALPGLEATRAMPERRAPDTTDAALSALDACLPGPEARCFLWVHYQDPHGPYTPPETLRQRALPEERRAADADRELPVLEGPFGAGGIPAYQFLEGHRDVAFYRAGYAGEVALLDAELGRLLEGLRERGLYDASVLVFTADHGESLGEDDYWFSHGERLSEVQVRVPLLLHVPGLAPRARDDLASLVDLRPTLTRLLLGTPPDPQRPGRDLLAPDAEARPSTPYLAALRGAKRPRYGIARDRFKYVVVLREDGVWDGRLTRRDRDDVDLTPAAPQLAAELRERLQGLMERYRRVEVESRRDLSAADREKLRALGYLEP
jgi:choline-sulfatase